MPTLNRKHKNVSGFPDLYALHKWKHQSACGLLSKTQQMREKGQKERQDSKKKHVSKGNLRVNASITPTAVIGSDQAIAAISQNTYCRRERDKERSIKGIKLALQHLRGCGVCYLNSTRILRQSLSHATFEQAPNTSPFPVTLCYWFEFSCHNSR
jgi:hypothetical protein